MKFQYRSRSPFLVLERLAKYDLDDADRFVAWSEHQRGARQRHKEAIARPDCHDDEYVDDFAEIESFASVYGELSIVALWRCVELFRRRSIAQVLDVAEAKHASYHDAFCRMLVHMNVSETDLHCSADVNELRCINNAVKHEGRVNAKLATFGGWSTRLGEQLGDLRSDYARLRPHVESYIEDLASRGTAW